MYSSSRSATHHIFFPPRLEVVVQKENADSFSSYPGCQLALDGFLGDEAHGPSGGALGRVAANHGDDALLLGGVEHGSGTRALFFIERGLQPTLLVAAREIADGLRGQADHGGNLRWASAFGQVQQRQSA